MKPVTLRRYVLRFGHAKMDWAEFVIGDNGFFSVVSSYGNYAFRWTHFGDCFRSFLAQTDGDYVQGKLAPERHFDGEETLLEIKRRIVALRRLDRISRDEAREEYDRLREIGSSWNEVDFADWVRETTLDDVYELAQYRRSNQVIRFSEIVLPLFQAELRRELEAEKMEAASA